MYLAEMVTLRMVPVAAIALLNALIVSRVTRITRDRKRRRQNIPLLTVDPGTATHHFSASPAVVAVVNNDSRASVSSRGVRRVSLDDKNLQLTIVLIIVSSTYVLFFLPVLVHFVILTMNQSGVFDVGFKFLDVFGNYAKALHVAGFAINFLLYTVSGRVFREQLLALLCRSRCRPVVFEDGCRGPGRTASTPAPGKLSAV